MRSSSKIMFSAGILFFISLCNQRKSLSNEKGAICMRCEIKATKGQVCNYGDEPMKISFTTNLCSLTIRTRMITDMAYQMVVTCCFSSHLFYKGETEL
jgi:hypothetical protein